jgi:uncharacterized delta-60 repeat protein
MTHWSFLTKSLRNGLRTCWQALLAAAMLGASALPAAAQTPGDFDTTPFPGFAAGNGKIPNLGIGTGVDQANALALQPDGKIVLAGTCFNGDNSDFCIARLNADGSLDASFDGPGGAGNGKFLVPIGASGDVVAYALALQPDGKIVIAGYCSNGVNADFCIARLNADGALDASFDGPSGAGDGKFLLPIGTSNDYAYALALQPDGKIVLAGECFRGSSRDVCIARLNADGTLDASFDGPSGVGYPGFPGNGKFPLSIVDISVANALALQPDGKIVIAGYCVNGSNSDFCIARLNADGSFDASFDGPSGLSGGVFLLPIGASDDVASALALQPDGKIVIAGYCSNGGNFDFCIARLNADGSLDASFVGPSGVSSGKILLPIGASSDVPYGLAMQPDGKIVIAGRCVNGGSFEFCIARLNANGSLDAGFDGPSGAGNGTFLLPISAGSARSDVAYALALQPDGKIVLAGTCFNGSNNDFCVARLYGGPFGAQNCKLDFDGDGIVTATTDMLIGMRVSLGIRGSEVIGGISFPDNATRKTWPLIRNYLVSQCGLSVY